MTTVKTLLETYERTGSYRQTARKMGVAHNTVRKYVLRAQAAREAYPATGRSTNHILIRCCFPQLRIQDVLETFELTLRDPVKEQ